MQTNTSLDKLHDIYTPPLIGFEWNDGQIILAILACSVLASLSYFIIQNYKANEYKREALKELAHAKNAEELFSLIKRVLLSTKPRQEVASLSGAELLRYIGKEQSTHLIQAQQSIYNKALGEKDFLTCKQEVRRWLRGYKA
jgi:hypothetical protein